MIKKIFANFSKTALAASAAVMILSGAALADDIALNMEGSSATVPKGNTVTRKIFNIPKGIPGTIRLKLKWHAVNIIPNTFNALKVTLKHGSTTIKTDTCYSFHSNKSPKCNFSIAVSDTEADRDVQWTLTIVNNSNDEVIGFDIAKAGDVNPLVPNFASVYDPNCPDTKTLDMEGTTLTLTKGSTQVRKLFGFGAANGDVILKMKWHAVSAVPNTFVPLKVEVLNGNTVVASSNCYSIHSNKSPKCSFDFDSGNRPPDQWKLRITNNSKSEVIGFNIEKEKGDINPLVPNFFSTYKAKCQ
ncbi:MAG: hypothetical protein R2747_13795 [Pyrinomonadaceae bacterium]